MNYLFKGYCFYCNFTGSSLLEDTVDIWYSRIIGNEKIETQVPMAVFAVLAAQVGLVGAKCRYQGAAIRPVHLAVHATRPGWELILHTYEEHQTVAGAEPIVLWRWRYHQDDSATSKLVDDIIDLLNNPLLQAAYLSHIPSDTSAHLTMGGPYEGGGDNHNLDLEVLFSGNFESVDLISNGNTVTVSTGWISQWMVDMFGVPYWADPFDYPSGSIPQEFYKFTWGAGMAVTVWRKYLGEPGWQAQQTIVSSALCQILVTALDWVARARAALPIQSEGGEVDYDRIEAMISRAVGSAVEGVHSHINGHQQQLDTLVRHLSDQNGATQFNQAVSMAILLSAYRKSISPKRLQQAIEVLSDFSCGGVAEAKSGQRLSEMEPNVLSVFMASADKYGRLIPEVEDERPTQKESDNDSDEH